MFKSTMFCLVDNFDLTKIANFGFIQLWECVLNKFTLKPVHRPKLGIRHLHGLGAIMFFLLIPMCK